MVVPYVLDAVLIISAVTLVGLVLSFVHAMIMLFRKKHFLPRDKETRRRLARTQTIPIVKPQRLRKIDPNRPPPPQYFYVDIETVASVNATQPGSSGGPSEPSSTGASNPSTKPNNTESSPDRGIAVNDEFVLRVKRDLALYYPPDSETQALKLKLPPHVHGRLPNCRRPLYLSEVGVNSDETDKADELSLVSDDDSEVCFNELDPEGKRMVDVKTTSATLLKLLAMPADVEDMPIERDVTNVVITAEDRVFASLKNTKMK